VTTGSRTPLPAIPHHRRRTGQPRRHGLQLPPARHPRPGRGDYPEAERRYQQSLTINAELGNRAGTANSYHNLGILAQARGDTRKPNAATSNPSPSTQNWATAPASPRASANSETCMQQRTERRGSAATLQGPSHPPRPQHPPSTEQHQPTSRTPHTLGRDEFTRIATTPWAKNQQRPQPTTRPSSRTRRITEHNLPGKMEMRPLRNLPKLLFRRDPGATPRPPILTVSCGNESPSRPSVVVSGMLRVSDLCTFGVPDSAWTRTPTSGELPSGQFGHDREARTPATSAPNTKYEKPISSRRLRISSAAAAGSLGRKASESAARRRWHLFGPAMKGRPIRRAPARATRVPRRDGCRSRAPVASFRPRLCMRRLRRSPCRQARPPALALSGRPRPSLPGCAVGPSSSRGP